VSDVFPSTTGHSRGLLHAENLGGDICCSTNARCIGRFPGAYEGLEAALPIVRFLDAARTSRPSATRPSILAVTLFVRLTLTHRSQALHAPQHEARERAAQGAAI